MSVLLSEDDVEWWWLEEWVRRCLKNQGILSLRVKRELSRTSRNTVFASSSAADVVDVEVVLVLLFVIELVCEVMLLLVSVWLVWFVVISSLLSVIHVKIIWVLFSIGRIKRYLLYNVGGMMKE